MPSETAGSSIASDVIIDCICSMSLRASHRVFDKRSSAADAERAASNVSRMGESAASADVAFQIAIASGKLPARNRSKSCSRNFRESDKPLRSMLSCVVARKLTTSKERSRSRSSLTSHTASLPTRRIQRERRYSAKSISKVPCPSQSLTVLSHEPEVSVFPSGLHATLKTVSVCPCKVVNSLPVAASQSLTARSREPEASVFPSGLHATIRTASVCPCKVVSSFPVAASQSLTAWSREPEVSVFPSGLHATLKTAPVCPCKVMSSLPVSASQSLTVLSPEPEASFFPSGLQVTHKTGPSCSRYTGVCQSGNQR